jgi:NADH-quinone oxidoreductase subunit J
MSYLLFIIYGVLFFSVVSMVLCVNPIHSVLFFIVVFFCASLVFTLLHADFIGLIFLMVYVGAIAVLFIFVVMMLNIKRIERDATTYLLVGGFISCLFSLQLIYLFFSTYTIHSPTNVEFSNAFMYDYLTNNDEFVTKYLVQLIGIYIFSEHYVVLVFSGVTLLVSLIGSVYLTNTKTGYSVRRQDSQLSRKPFLMNVHTL